MKNCNIVFVSNWTILMRKIWIKTNYLRFHSHVFTNNCRVRHFRQNTGLTFHNHWTHFYYKWICIHIAALVAHSRPTQLTKQAWIIYVRNKRMHPKTRQWWIEAIFTVFSTNADIEENQVVPQPHMSKKNQLV